MLFWGCFWGSVVVWYVYIIIYLHLIIFHLIALNQKWLESYSIFLRKMSRLLRQLHWIILIHPAKKRMLHHAVASKSNNSVARWLNCPLIGFISSQIDYILINDWQWLVYNIYLSPTMANVPTVWCHAFNTLQTMPKNGPSPLQWSWICWPWDMHHGEALWMCLIVASKCP